MEEFLKKPEFDKLPDLEKKYYQELCTKFSGRRLPRLIGYELTELGKVIKRIREIPIE